MDIDLLQTANVLPGTDANKIYCLYTSNLEALHAAYHGSILKRPY